MPARRLISARWHLHHILIFPDLSKPGGHVIDARAWRYTMHDFTELSKPRSMQTSRGRTLCSSVPRQVPILFGRRPALWPRVP